ncbi:MAG: enoyl-CoA hydratase [Gammaproteobacteria bacterium]|nr:enoyl-CoA hydratase [Gammaproteobacteria bacterium]NIM74598.1 enoyl-CoA hydratase [Gammaproteobacteria bacterium]NIO26431.1 enoyl-CoA hydratase [Gammaproteobacteria bacterium]NIO66983.1 enoyl-CoA hydratase [Gammaproteobacteria bacterium]NIP46819.1 enoyl-CoA hydratase [Gammaproteobacteria bacterium]
MSTPAADMAADEVLLREDAAGVCTLTLNRPRYYNALSEDLIAALQKSFDAIAGDRSVRVVVIAGAGKGFCAGHDLKEMMAHSEQAYFDDLFARCNRMMQSLMALPQPVIARVHGLATANGCQLVSICDLAVAADTAKFALCGVRLGLFCSTPSVGVSRNLPRKRAFEMLVTGEFVDAATAVRDGLINRAVPEARLDEEVRRLADSIIEHPAVAIETGKRMFYRQLELDVAAAYDYAGKVMAGNMMEEDTIEGIKAFVEKRPPRWRGR